MKRSPIVLTILVLASCTRPSEKSYETTNNAIKNFPSNMAIQERFPAYVKKAQIPDTLVIDADNVIYGDFNADQKEDLASMVTNSNNGFKGVLIIHNKENPSYSVFGAGKEVNGMNNLDWIHDFQTIPKGEIIAPTLVDEQTGDIIGADDTRKFKLIGTAIYVHVDESEGGGIIFWNGNKYEWYHLE